MDPGIAASPVTVQRFLEGHHVAFILGFRFFFGLCTVSFLAIGMSDVGLRRYLLLSSLGSLA